MIRLSSYAPVGCPLRCPIRVTIPGVSWKLWKYRNCAFHLSYLQQPEELIENSMVATLTWNSMPVCAENPCVAGSIPVGNQPRASGATRRAGCHRMIQLLVDLLKGPATPSTLQLANEIFLPKWSSDPCPGPFAHTRNPPLTGRSGSLEAHPLGDKSPSSVFALSFRLLRPCSTESGSI